MKLAPCVCNLMRLRWCMALCATALICLLGGAAQAQHVPGNILVKFKPWVGEQQQQHVLQQTQTSRVRALDGIGVQVLRTPDGVSEHVKAQQLRNRGEVLYAEVDVLVGTDQTAPNDPQYAQQWHLPKIKSPGAWAHTTGSDEIIIAILDTGVDPNHSDLQPKLFPGWNTWSNNSNTWDVDGHGTRVAGVAAAATHNSTGVAGVAWDCRIMPIRITNDNGYAALSTIASGLVWAADNGARVANVSFSAWASATVQDAAKYFQDTAGGVVTMSAGNQGTFWDTANSPYIIVVSATNTSDGLTSFTNSGNYVDLAAPGIGIRTTLKGGGYGNASGTSFAAPIVAGVSGLVLSANPSLSGAQVRGILLNSADDLGPAGWDPGYGWGRVNASAAVTVALGSGGDAPHNDSGSNQQDDQPEPPADTVPPTITIVSPANNATVSGQVNVAVNAWDDVGVTLVELYVNGSLTMSATSPPFTLRLNANPLAVGAHQLQAKAYDAAGNVGVSPIVTVHKEGGSSGGGGGGGNQGGGKGGGKKN